MSSNNKTPTWHTDNIFWMVVDAYRDGLRGNVESVTVGITTTE